MKKLLFSAMIAVFGLLNVNAQDSGFEAGAFVGVPVADVGDGTSFNIGATVAYYFEVMDNFKVGGLVGYDHFIGKEYDVAGMTIDGEDAGFIPIAASAKYNFVESFFAGVDLGYAIGITDGAGDGGFLYRPRIGWSTSMVDLYAFYKGISYKYDVPTGLGVSSVTATAGSVGIGAAFKF